MHESLGMTEMAGISSIRPPGVRGPAGCVGFPIPFARVRVVELDTDGGPTDRDLPDGQHGMILFKAPNVFPGYLDAAATAKSFTGDGWLITGDVGWRDAEGRLHLTGRSKDMIIRGNHNIDPKVIEDALESHADVQICAAFGAPDAYAGELPVAFAVAQPDAVIDPAELLDWTAARVDERPARPKWVEVIDTMPMTNVGKIFKPELRRLATERTTLDLIAALIAEHPSLLGTTAAARLQPDGRIAVDIALPDRID